MKNILNYSIYLCLILIGLSSCQTIKDGLEGNKKSKSAEEFLIQKKNPLVLPPDYSKLPLPDNVSIENESDNNFDLQKALEQNSSSSKKNSQSQTSSSFEKSIVDKIKKN